MNKSYFGEAIIMALVATVFGSVCFVSVGIIGDLKSQAIQRGYAIHCPIDGNFAWKGECDE